ncbi:LysR family transcriptional regulator [Burkholderia sp. SFA1]|uniref:LysR family transcriptional regulator n=1 Tax=unclassified Caballeronia TaxID=2646786 RepID=UPI001F24EF1E|nr:MULTISPECIES: LysR family transcriptional regulator [unclassified Caballeronia]MCE4544455.1 LysR family transcriptional regulator [Caballeronia sp. PC1]MCE4571607.1 LysR family transcriptional regulator [Caballeronia sp. CLC5]BBP98479.1 LysR family transcriptional regulator [Burkholderia sp. SFA1]
MKTNTDELLVFVTVIDAGSMTAAAEMLQQTVSGVSRTLTRLEKKLDATLVRRTTRRLQLTDEGELFLARARAILAAMEDAEETMARHRERPAGRLRVDAASPFVLHCIVPHVQAFAALYPEITLELTSNERIVDLLEQRVDIAIRIGALRDSTLRARALGSSRLRVLASPAYLAEHGEPRDIDELMRARLIGFTAPESLNDWPLADTRDGRGASFVSIRAAIAASSGETIRQLALDGGGIACLAEFMTAADMRAGRLRTILDDILEDVRQPVNAVYYQSESMAVRSRAFLDFLASRLEL